LSDFVKTVTNREFFRQPSLTSSLHPGEVMVVTKNGRRDFVVTKTTATTFKTVEELRREAARLCPTKGRRIDLGALLDELRR
jgi:hypothetical protein